MKNIPTKGSSRKHPPYTKMYGLKVEEELKERIEFLSKLDKKKLEKLGVGEELDVPEVVRIALRSTINKLYNKFKDASL